MYEQCGYYYCMNYSFMLEEPFRLIDIGVEERKDEIYDFNNEARADYAGYLFQYTLKGKGYFEFEGRRYQLGPGMAFLIPFPHASRYYLDQNLKSEWTFFFVHFTGSSVANVVKEILKHTGPVITFRKSSDVISCFFKEFEALQQGKEYKRYESGEFLYRFLTTILREVETPYLGDSRCVDQALQWMQRNYASQQNLSDMCREIEVTLPHLTRQFHKEMGITPEQYLINIRIGNAVRLLSHSSLTIHEVAQKCGFSCGNYFAKVFQKKIHMSPRKYRELHCS